MLNFLRKNMQKFKKIPDRSVKMQLRWRRRLGNFKNFLRLGGGAAVFISYQRRGLRNFKNFLRLGGGGCIFLGKIGGGGSADRLTPLAANHSSSALRVD
jgi:hypothetical protein